MSDELVSGLVTERLAQGDCEQGFILDGYPRTRKQAETLDRMLAERGVEPVVIHLVVDYNIVIARLSRRSQCPLCGTLYNATSKPPRVAGVCDLDGTKLVVRDDDQGAVVRERLDAYQRQTKPLLEYFRQTGRRLEEIDASYQTPAILVGPDSRNSRKAMIIRKTPAELEKMRRSGLLVYQILEKLREMAVEGVSTLEMETAAEQMIADAGAKPAFKNYFVPAAGERYRFVLCTSINEEIVHGMPSAETRPEEGRYRFDRYGRAVGWIFWRFGRDGGGGRSERANEAAAGGHRANRSSWRSTRCAPATGCSMCADRLSSTW